MRFPIRFGGSDQVCEEGLSASQKLFYSFWFRVSFSSFLGSVGERVLNDECFSFLLYALGFFGP